MFHAPGSARNHIALYQNGEATGPTVARLFDSAAQRLEALGPVFVRHVALDTVDDARSSEICLTIYYDLDVTGSTDAG